MSKLPPIPDIKKENQERKKRFLGHETVERTNKYTGETYKLNFYHDYNPETGEGSTVPRKDLKLLSTLPGKLRLPEPMFEEDFVQGIQKHGGLDVVAKETKQSLDELMGAFIELRYKYDFEYWTYTCVKIKDKRTARDIPFVLRPAQLKLLAKLEEMRWKGTPIRVVLLKARQWGGSTLVQIYMNWIQLFVKSGWSSAIVAEVEDQSKNIRNMFSHLAERHPKDIKNIQFVPYEGSSKNRVLKGTTTVIGVGSAEKPNSLRSFNYYMLHLSEVGLWGDTAKKSADDLVQSLRGMVNTEPDTLIVMESTAKGTGNLFHKEWLAAAAGESGYAPVFVAWWEIEEYLRPLDMTVKEFVSSMNDYEKWLWEIGATLEGIYWYRTKLHTERMDEWRMKEEFPSTPGEAFQSSGKRVFAHKYVSLARKGVQKPMYQGELIADGQKGKEALKNIKFAKNSKGGSLKLWNLPYSPELDDPNQFIMHRYCVFGDIGGRAKGTDWSVLTVLDRYWMLYGGAPERVATWRGHLDQDLFAWEAARVAKWFDNALLAIEVNSLKKHENTDGDHYLTVLDEIVNVYRNLFSRTHPEKVKQGAPQKWGFHTNTASKTMIINSLNGALRDETYVERDEMAIREMDYYEIKEDGSYGAKEGMHDDIVITSAGAHWLATQYMPPPKIVTREDPEIVRSRKRTATEAVI